MFSLHFHMPVLFIRNGELVELQNFNAEHKKPLEYPKAFNFTLSMSPFSI